MAFEKLCESIYKHTKNPPLTWKQRQEDYITFTKEQSTLREHLSLHNTKEAATFTFTQCEPKKLFGLCFGAIRTGNNLIFQFYPYRKKETESTILKAKDPPPSNNISSLRHCISVHPSPSFIFSPLTLLVLFS